MFYRRLILTLALTLAIFAVSAKAQQEICPLGSQQMTVQLWAGGCEWNVDICYKCGLFSTDQVSVIGATKVDSDCEPELTFNDVLADLNSQVFDWSYLSTVICVGAEMLPCDEYPGGLWYDLCYHMCWTKQIDENGRLTYTACLTSQTYCMSGYRYCWDPITQQAVRYLMYGPSISGSFTCDNVLEPIETPNYPNWSTCFEVSSPCNP
jgi:hypothetical protein